jgi:hypothetical protein
MHVEGANPSSSAFAGSESGVTIALDPGAYAVTETGPSGYDADYSGQCSGVMVFSNKTCTITNTFHVDSGGGDDTPACSDGDDNDTDGKIDFPADPGCTDANDTDETDPDNGGGGNNDPECSDGDDNDSDGQIDFPADSSCSNADDDSEADDNGGGGDNDDNNGGGSHHSSHHGSSSSNNDNDGEVLGAETECPMYLTGYIKYGAQNDAGEVSKLQVFLNEFEANALAVTGVYDAPTLAAVNAFQTKYAADVLSPWGMQGPSGYVYYTTQKEINTIYCKFQKGFPLSDAQVEEIVYVRDLQPQLRAQRGGAEGTQTTATKASSSPAVGSVVLPGTTKDENAPDQGDNASQTAAAANATSTQGWFSQFVHWLFGR